MAGENDQAMKEPDNWLSNTFNSAVNGVMGAVGYDTTRRAPDEDNPFYRDNAQYMPGWSMPGTGLPSGAYAQDRATNYVGHDTGDPAQNQVWNNVRTSLVQQEGDDIKQNQADGGTGKLSFGQVYDAHVQAYDHAHDDVDPSNPQGGADGHNGFVDPASFALAVYGAPALEAVGINSGPITGASIDAFNDPTDTALGGWGKRMGLAAGEMGAGLAAMPLNPLVGVGLMGLGAFSGAYNTVTAIEHGAVGQAVDAIGNEASAVGGAVANEASAIGGAVADEASAVGGAVANEASAVGGAVADEASSLWHGVTSLF